MSQEEPSRGIKLKQNILFKHITAQHQGVTSPCSHRLPYYIYFEQPAAQLLVDLLIHAVGALLEHKSIKPI